MKSFLYKIIFVSAFAFLSAVQINAQLCGKYATFILIETAEGKPVDNAVVRLIPLGKNETLGETFVREGKKRSEFSITFNEGHILSGKYKIIISAEGFKTHEFETGFPHCERRNFILKLEKSNSRTENDLEEIREINFRAIDENKKGIGDVRTTVSREKGKVLEKISNEYGQTDFEVFNNKILKVRFEKDGYKTKEIEIDLSKNNFKYMDVKMEKVEP